MPTTAQITSVALKLASALAYLHERGVIHGDLKPQNIVFDGDEPILIDFGLSQFLPGYVRSPILAGSLPFIIQTETFRAPELEARTRRILYDFKIDTFSLGGTLYKFLTSQYPVPSIARASDSYKNYYVDSYSEVRKNLLDLTVDYRDLLVPLLQHQSSQRQACRRFLQDRNITVETFTFQLPEDLTLPSQFRRKMYERIKNRVRISGLVKDCPNSEIYAWSLQILLQMEMLLEVFQNRTLKNNIPGSKKDSLTEDVITMITDFAIFFVTGYDDEIANYDNTFQKFIAEYLFAGGKLQFLPRDIDCLKMLKKYIR
jgi:serine/threonine protein kinase